MPGAMKGINSNMEDDGIQTVSNRSEMSHQQKHSRKRRCSVAQVFALGDVLFLFVRVIRIGVVDILSRTSLCWVGYWHTCLETLFSDMRLA